MRMILSSIAFAILATACGQTPNASSLAARREESSVSVLFSPNGGVAAEILEQLKHAEQRVDIAMYSFSDSKIQDQVVDLAKAGLPVRVILDTAREKAPLADKLENAGIDVRYVIPVMHHKFAVIDGPRGNEEVNAFARVITGSANWSRSSDGSYDEDFLTFVGDSEKTLAFQSEFDFLWDHARDYEGTAEVESGESVERQTNDSTFFTSANFTVSKRAGEWSFRAQVEPAEGAAGTQIVAAIKETKRGDTLKIATTHMRREDFYDALLAAHKRGVQVTMILDQQEYRTLRSAPAGEESDIFYDEKLAAAGVDVRYKAYMVRWNASRAQQMHSKYMIVNDDKVLTGSFNWSSNSEVGSIENLNILTGSIVKDYAKNFAKVSSYGSQGELESLLGEVKSSGGTAPCSFAPVTLTVEQFESLRKSYKSTACRSAP